MPSPCLAPAPPLALVRAFECSRVAAAATAAAYELIWPIIRRPLPAARRGDGRPARAGRSGIPASPVVGGSCA
jgi:hypothetical protein